MKQKLFLALLIVMFFVLSTSTLFAQTRDFDASSNVFIEIFDADDTGKWDTNDLPLDFTDPNNHIIIGDKVKVTVTDVDHVDADLAFNSGRIDFRRFYEEDQTPAVPIWVDLIQEGATDQWVAEYEIGAGTLNGTTYDSNIRVEVTLKNTDVVSRAIDQQWRVNNVVVQLTNIEVISSITNPSPSNENLAIIGSTIRTIVSKADIDLLATEPAPGFGALTHLWADFSEFVGTPTEILINTATSINIEGEDYYYADYEVPAGNLNTSGKAHIIAKYTTPVNAGKTLPENSNALLVNNVRPTEGLLSNLQMAINGINDETVMRLGDFIRVKGSIENVQPNNKVDKIVIDWGLTFDDVDFGGGVTTQEVQAQIDPGSDPETRSFSVDFTPPAGLVDIDGNSVEYLSPLVIYITDLISTVGNHATANPTVSGTTGWDVGIDKNSAGSPVEVLADMTPPSLAGATDLYYDILNDHLRFSPNTADVDGYATTPNTFDIYVDLPNWGTDIHRFTLQFVNENRSALYRTFEYDAVTPDPAITVRNADNAAGQLIVHWDGTADNDVPVYDPAVPNTTIGITLWAIEDEVGNAAELTYATSVEYTVANGHNDINDGEVYLNRLHVVVDNQPVTQTTAQRLKPTDPDFTTFSEADPIVIKRFINAEDGDPFDETDIVMPKDEIILNSRINRVFEVNTVPQRDETVAWWAILENDDSSIKQYWNGGAWVDYVGFDHLNDSSPVGFTPGATLSNLLSFNWDLENTGANLADYPAGDYKIYAYYMDNAGNIVKDGNEVFVTIENVFYQLPVITDVQITSTHINDGAGLPTQTGGYPVFYLDGFALAGADEYRYYTTSDTIEITVTLNNWENLVDDVDGHTLELDLSVLGLGVINVNKSQISNTAFTYVHTIDVATLANALADYEDYDLEQGVTMNRQFSIGDDDPNEDISVRVFDKEETYGEAGVYAGNNSDFFNIRIPDVPSWPAADGEYAADLSATHNVFSPGNPNNAYDALTNPAFDGEIDETQFEFNYTNQAYDINYELSFQRLGGDTLLVTNGNFDHGNSGNFIYPATPFDGIVDANPITNANPTLAGDLVEDFNLILNITVAPDGVFEDPGYATHIPVLYDNSDNPYIVTVDNQNPSLVDGDGSTVNITDRHITIPGYETEVPVLTNTINEIEFTVHTSEFLTADFVAGAYDPAFDDNGDWSILLVGEDGAVLNGGDARVQITEIVGSDDDGNEAERLFKTFAITAQISGVTDFDYPNAKLVVRLPNDPAGNPGRRNYPNNYPYNAHNEWNDSSEYFINVHILKHKPNIVGISFTYKDVMGTLDDDEGTIDPPAFVTNDPADLEFVLAADIKGGAYRAIETNWVADLSPLMGNGEGDVNLTLEPVDQLMAGTYVLVWESDYDTDPDNPIVFNIDPAIAATWEHGDELILNVYVVTGEDGDTYHEVIRSITVTVDLEAPVITNNTIETMTIPAVPNGGFDVVFDISDDNSGVDWDYYDNIWPLVADDARYEISEDVEPTAIAVDDVEGTVTFTFNQADFADYTHFTVTLLTQDKMDNEGEGTIFVNVNPLPILDNVVINESADFFGPNEDVVVEWTVSDPQRVNALTVTLSRMDLPGPVVLTELTIDSDITAAMSHTFLAEDVFNGYTAAEIEALDDELITATVTGITNRYVANADPALAPDLDEEYPLVNDIDVIQLDSVPPVITSNTAFVYTELGTPKTLAYTITDASSGFNGDDVANYELTLPEGITVDAGTWMDDLDLLTFNLTIADDSEIQYFTPTLTVNDNVENESSLTTYVNVRPIPVISNVDVNTGNDANYYVPGTSLTVMGEVTNHQRVDRMVITVTEDAEDSDFEVEYVIPYDSNDFDGNIFSYVFDWGVNTPADGAELIVTVTGYTKGYGANDDDTIIDIPLEITEGENIEEITVDTKPVIVNNFDFFRLNDEPILALQNNMSGFDIFVEVESVNDIDQNSVAVVNPSFEIQFINNPINDFTVDPTDKYIFGFINSELEDLSIDFEEERFVVVDLQVTVATIYGYTTTEDIQIVVFEEPSHIYYSKENTRGENDMPEPFSVTGETPDGWFAPEHQLITTYQFTGIDLANDVNYLPVTIEADFENVNDAVPNQFVTPSKITSEDTIVTIEIMGAEIPVTLSEYNATWVLTDDEDTQNDQQYADFTIYPGPNVQHLYHAYNDGDQVEIPVRYNPYSINSYILSDIHTVQVDLEVPIYNQILGYAISVESKDLDLEAEEISYQAIASQEQLYNNIMLLLPVDEETGEFAFSADEAIYLKVYAEDNNGTGVGLIDAPVIPGWTVEAINFYSDPDFGYVQEWKITPTVAELANINHLYELNVALGEIEDLVGRRNYAGPQNHLSNRYAANAPTLTFTFTRGDNDGTISNILAYEFGNPASTPYVKDNLGMIIELARAGRDDRSAISDVVPAAVAIQLEEDGPWTDLVRLISNNEDADYNYIWMLDSGVYIGADKADEEVLAFSYRITYNLIDLDGDVIVGQNQVYTSDFITSFDGNDIIVVDRQTPEFVSITVDSEANLPENYNYIIPGYGVTIDVVFSDVTGYYTEEVLDELGNVITPATKPVVKLSNINEFLDNNSLQLFALDAPNYIVPERFITNLGDGQWSVSIGTDEDGEYYLRAKEEADFAGQPHSYDMGVIAEDAVGNIQTDGKFVQIAANGPIVPLITGASFTTILNAGSPEEKVLDYLVKASDDLLAEQYLNVDIYTQYENNISDVEIFGAIPTGLEFADYEINQTDDHRFTVSFRVTGTPDVEIGSLIEGLQVKAIGEPYGYGPIFTHIWDIDAIEVGEVNFNASTLVVKGINLDDVEVNAVNPNNDIQITVEIDHIAEGLVTGLDPRLEDIDVNDFVFDGWFNVSSNMIIDTEEEPFNAVYDVEFETEYGTVLNEEEEEVEIITNIRATVSFAVPAIALDNEYDAETAIFTVSYQNIYGLEKDITSTEIIVDRDEPTVNRVVLLDQNNNIVETLPTLVESSREWSKIRAYFDEDASGVRANTSLISLLTDEDAYSADLAPQMQALVAYNNAPGTYASTVVGYNHPDFDGEEYIEFDLNAIYEGMTAYDLWVGPYTIEVKAEDMFGNQYITYADDDIDELNPIWTAYVFNYDFQPAETQIEIRDVVKDDNGNILLQTADVNEDGDRIITAAVNHPDGTISGVHFRLYEPIFAEDGEIENWNEITVLFNGPNPDMTVPFQIGFNLEDNRFNFLPEDAADHEWIDEGDVYALAENYSHLRLRTTGISTTRYITDVNFDLHIFDSVGPTPEFEINGSSDDQLIEYDYYNTDNNILTLSAEFTANDVRYVRYMITDLEGNEVYNERTENIRAEEFESFNMEWNFTEVARNVMIGDYVAYAIGYDYLENQAISNELQFTIENTPALVRYDIRLFDVEGLTNDEELINNDNDNDNNNNNIFGGIETDKPYTDLNVRINANFFRDQDNDNFPFDGIEKFQFRAMKIDVVTGDTLATDLVVPRNDFYDIDYEIAADGWIETEQFRYQTGDVNANWMIDPVFFTVEDHTHFRYEFYVEMTPEDIYLDGVEFEYEYANLIIDNRAPQFNDIVVNYPVVDVDAMSWANVAGFVADAVAEYDAVELETAHLHWSLTPYSELDLEDEDVVAANIHNALVEFDLNEETMALTMSNWDVTADAINTYLGADFEGTVYMMLALEDQIENTSVKFFEVNVDNNAPETHITHILHGINYPNLTPIANNSTIEIYTSSRQGTNGAATLKLFVENNADIDPNSPVSLYHKTADGIWQPVLYDYEAWTNTVNQPAGTLYEFEIPTRMLAEGTHQFAVAAMDRLGNLEGVIAGNLADFLADQFVITEDAPAGYEESNEYIEALEFLNVYREAQNAGLNRDMLNNNLVPVDFAQFDINDDNDMYEILEGVYFPTYISELSLAVNLTVIVENIDDVVAMLEFPTDQQIISGLTALTADAYKYDDNDNLIDSRDKVQSMRFDRKNALGQWVTMGTVAKALTEADFEDAEDFIAEDHMRTINFRLDRKDVPEFDGLPWVPGVHVLVNDDPVALMTWNNDGQYWTASHNFAMGEYELAYGIDLNNDGQFNPNITNDNFPEITDEAIDCPKGFTALTVTPWTMAFDTIGLAQGLHEIRVTPLDENGATLTNYQSPSTFIFIDNVAPVLTDLSAEPVGNIYTTNHPYGEPVQAVQQGQEISFNYNVDNILVSDDDYVQVYFQWSGQAPNVEPNTYVYRRWFDFDTEWTAENPLTDGIDNNNNGMEDEALEANSFYYIRAIAKDAAGNHHILGEHKIMVDNSPVEMALTHINDEELLGENYIFNIPAIVDEDNPIILTATNMTNDIFDPAVRTNVQYRSKTQYAGVWPNEWNTLAEDLLVDADGNVEFAMFENVAEGYYQFRFIAEDDLGNVDPNPTVVTVIFNDTNGSILSVVNSIGETEVYEFENNDTLEFYAFAQNANSLGNVDVTVTNVVVGNSVAVEYSLDMNTWNQAGNNVVLTAQDIDVDGIAENITIPWTVPAIRAVEFFVRVKTTDNNNNYTYSTPVTVYNNVTETQIAIVDFPTIQTVDGFEAFVLNAEDEEVSFDVEYTNTNAEFDFNLVEKVTLKISEYDAENEQEAIMTIDFENDEFVLSNEFVTTFSFEMDALLANDGLEDGIYSLTIVADDIAGNVYETATQFVQIYHDQTAPVVAEFFAYEVDEDEEIVVINNALYTDTVDFLVQYEDLIGISEDGALNVTFTALGVTQTVTDYQLVTDEEIDENFLHFSFTADAAIRALVEQGNDYLDVNITLGLQDRLGNVLNAELDFELRSGNISYVRMMAVEDGLLSGQRINFVNWSNLENPFVAEWLGGDALSLYAYLPYQDVQAYPTEVSFEYRADGTTEWMEIEGNVVTLDNHVVDATLNNYNFTREYNINWNIADLAHGQYEVKTIAHYSENTSESIVSVNIYNQIITPQAIVTNDEGQVTELERGEVYTLNVENDSPYLNAVQYKFRYLNENNTPASEWSFFSADANGAVDAAWYNTENEITIYPRYLYNNKVQIVALAQDIWGTETLIQPVIANEAYVIVRIVDTIAPIIDNVVVEWANEENPEWISAIVETYTVSAEITSNLDVIGGESDVDYVELWIDGVLINTVDFDNVDVEDNTLTFTDLPVSADLAVTAVNVEIRAYDNAGNINTEALTINVDNIVPTTDFTVVNTNNIPVTQLANGNTVILNANAVDPMPGSGIMEYSYFYTKITDDIDFEELDFDNQWNLIFEETTVANPAQAITWEVANLDMGNDYYVMAVTFDNVGNMAYEVHEFTTGIEVLYAEVTGHGTFAPVNGEIPRRFHGEFTLMTNTDTVQDMNILYKNVDGVEYLPLTYFEYVDNNAIKLNLNDRDLVDENLVNGRYIIVFADQDNNELANVIVALDNEFVVEVAETEVPFMNQDTELVVNFTVIADSDTHIDNITESQIQLFYQEYNADGNNNWTLFENAEALTLTQENTNDGVNFTATFENIVLPNGYYNFKLRVQDRAIPVANVVEADFANEVLYDNVAPVVDIVSVTVDSEEIIDNDPINVQLGTTMTVTAEAFDFFSEENQTIENASGISYVEFKYYTGQWNADEVTVIGSVDTEPYTVDLNTLGLETGVYTVYAQAFDNAGNESERAEIEFNVVSPSELEPYALISSMSFNVEEHQGSNVDKIRASVTNWDNLSTIDQVEFQYFANGTWTTFNTFVSATNDYDNIEVTFNAELMNVEKLKTIVTYNNGSVSSRQPELEVTYANDELVPANQTITADLYWENQIHIAGSNNKPIVSYVNGEVFEGQINQVNINMVDGIWQAPFTVAQDGVYHFWAASLGTDGNMQLVETSLDVYANGDIVTDGVVTITVPTDYLYIQNLANAIALDTDFTALSEQRAIMTNSHGVNLTITMALNTVPNEEGTIFAMYRENDEWVAIEATYNAENNTATFTAPANTVYMIAQYSGTVIATEFVGTEPQYIDSDSNIWTAPDTEIGFLVYYGTNDQGGYNLLEDGEFEYQLFVNNIPVDAEYAAGMVTLDMEDLPVGEYALRLEVTKDGVTRFASASILVDVTAPVITATGSQLTIDNRVISAQIDDPETDIAAVGLTLTNNGNRTEGEGIVVPPTSIAVNGNIYSYELSFEDIYALQNSYSTSDSRSRNIFSITATWTAENNVELETDSVNVDYTVNVAVPVVTFTGGENGWWVNPTGGTELTFNVTVPEERTMSADGIEILLWEKVNQLDNNPESDTFNQIIEQLLPIEWNGSVELVEVNDNVYSYVYQYGVPTSPRTTAVLMEVIATDNYDAYGSGNKTYGIDYVAPITWALSPVGDVVDADAFPPTYESAVLDYGTNVTVGLAFQDITGFYTYENEIYHFWPSWDDFLEDGYGTFSPDIVYYTAASGIDPSSVTVYLNGEEIDGNVTNGNFVSNQGILAPGHYSVIASVADYSGNVSSLSFTFDVTGSAATITFDKITHENGLENYWLNTNDTNTFNFTVDATAQINNGGVVANFISIPSETVVQGPTTATLVDGKYRVELNGGIIPSNQVAVKLEVTVTDVWGGSAVSSQTYAIDNVAPQATITSPETDAQFVINHNVNITASITDVVPTEKAVSAGKISSLRESKVKFSASKDGNVQFSASNNNTFAARRLDSNDKSNGSGIYSVKLQIIGPNSVVTVDYPANTQAISYPFTVEVYGDYIINLISVDRVGNQSIETAEFTVVPSSAPIVTFNEINDNGWWLSNNANNSLTFTVVSDLAVTTQANIYAQPSGDLIVGPITVNPNNANNYAVSLASSLIPDEASSIELEIIATDVAGLSGIFTQTYNIDRIAPVITLFSPRNGTELTLTEELTAVTVKAEFMDLTTSITKGQKSQSGSGIANARLVITDPNNNSHITLTETEGETVIETVVTDLMIGTYTAVLTVNDKAGNQVIDQIQFIINPVPVEPAVLEITDAYIYPNPMTTDGGANFKLDLTASANVKIIIYDFAGREVKTIDKYSDAKSSSTVEWDGRNDDGTRLARGAYFARVIANDGKKIVETVVKVAITN